ncbi:MAG: biopolymer transporter ExbB [Gammaproteobacteria bacterium]|nr:MAG: biopolymer transporter ExbB [Gammaproteobacteria bacterium]
MFEIIRAGGWIMAPILACSVLALAIVLERYWTLRRNRVIPPKLPEQVWAWIESGQLDEARLAALRESSPLGRVLAAGLENRARPRDVLKEAIEDTGRHVAHELERFIGALGTIAAVTPLLGLLGTVLGMIQVFTVITTAGVGDPGQLAGGISQALITTAAGLSVAIPSLVFHRMLTARVDALVLDMEAYSRRLVETLHGRGGRGAGGRP